MTVQSTPITHKYKWPTVSGGACIDMRVAGRSEPQRATIPRTTTVRDPDGDAPWIPCEGSTTQEQSWSR